MNYKMMGRFVSRILFMESFFMIPALLISLGYREAAAAKSFAVTIAFIFVIAAVLSYICKGAPSAFRAREGLVCVGVSWIIMSLPGLNRRKSGCPWMARIRLTVL